MKKRMLVLQKVMFGLFILTVICCFVYSLGFMTQYRELQYLSKPVNKVLYNFHHEVLIPFNNSIFYLTLIGVIMFIVVFVAKLNKRLPNLLSMILGVVATIPTIIAAVLGLGKLGGIKAEYLTFDFSNVASEIYEEYNPSTLAFEIGQYLFVVALVIMIAFIVTIVINWIINKEKKYGSC